MTENAREEPELTTNQEEPWSGSKERRRAVKKDREEHRGQMRLKRVLYRCFEGQETEANDQISY
jgi:hypothetical protein